MTKTYKPGWRQRQMNGRTDQQSRFLISQLKVLLPLGILFTLAAVFLLPKLGDWFKNHNQQPTMERILKANPKLENKIIQPKFESFDKKGHPFLVEAESALQNSPEKTDLSMPSGNIQLEDGSMLSFSASSGIYFKDTETLELNNDVTFKTDKGYDMKTTSLTLFVRENRGQGHEPVTGTGPSGETITAEGFKIIDKGDRIDFLGKTLISLPGT